MISRESIDIVKGTAPIVKANAVAITSLFYEKMLGRHPELYNYFNEKNQKRAAKKGDAPTGSRSFGNIIPGEAPTIAPTKGEKAAEDERYRAGSQAKTLADAIIAYATNIDALENLSDMVNRMCHKHATLGVRPEQLPDRSR